MHICTGKRAIKAAAEKIGKRPTLLGNTAGVGCLPSFRPTGIAESPCCCQPESMQGLVEGKALFSFIFGFRRIFAFAALLRASGPSAFHLFPFLPIFFHPAPHFYQSFPFSPNHFLLPVPSFPFYPISFPLPAPFFPFGPLPILFAHRQPPHRPSFYLVAPLPFRRLPFCFTAPVFLPFLPILPPACILLPAPYLYKNRNYSYFL